MLPTTNRSDPSHHVFREWNKDAEEMSGSSWELTKAGPLRSGSFFDGDNVMETDRDQNTKSVLGWLMQVAEAWEETSTPQCETVLNVCEALPDECTVTEAERSTTEATMPVISLARYGQVVHDLSGNLVTLEVSGNKAKRGRLSTVC